MGACLVLIAGEVERELMRSCGCEFQSLREQFDTTTAAGEMVLYAIANIAQFERKRTSERISVSFKARAETGNLSCPHLPLRPQFSLRRFQTV